MSEILSLSRMARRLGVPQSWLRTRAQEGDVPCLRADRKLLFNPTAVMEALASQALFPSVWQAVDEEEER